MNEFTTHLRDTQNPRDQASAYPSSIFAPRPLTPQEQASAENLGKTLRRMRRLRRPGERRISQRLLAETAGLSANGVGRVERGEGRTRVSTLRRVADALAELRPRLGHPAEIRWKLLTAGPDAIAPERGSVEFPPWTPPEPAPHCESCGQVMSGPGQ